MTALLSMRNVRHNYNGRTVLDIPSLDIVSGSITGLAGPNGSGKTTLLKILSLVEPCSSGTVLFQGRASQPFANHTRHRVSLLLQEPYLLKRSVFDNIAFGLKLRGTSDRLEEKVISTLELVGLPSSFSHRQWHELSGGEAQRVALAARLVLKPDCLLLDEPTTSVDMQSAERIKQAILLAQEQWGTTIIISSHQRQWLLTMCDRILFLFKGNLLPFSPENLLSGPWHMAEDGRNIKRLADGQFFFLPNLCENDCAALSPTAIRIVTGEEKLGFENILRGRVTGIFEKDKFPSRINLHTLCGDHVFVLEMLVDDMRLLRLQTGQEVKIGFSPEDLVRLPC